MLWGQTMQLSSTCIWRRDDNSFYIGIVAKCRVKYACRSSLGWFNYVLPNTCWGRPIQRRCDVQNSINIFDCIVEPVNLQCRNNYHVPQKSAWAWVRPLTFCRSSTIIYSKRSPASLKRFLTYSPLSVVLTVPRTRKPRSRSSATTWVAMNPVLFRFQF